MKKLIIALFLILPIYVFSQDTTYLKIKYLAKKQIKTKSKVTIIKWSQRNGLIKINGHFFKAKRHDKYIITSDCGWYSVERNGKILLSSISCF